MSIKAKCQKIKRQVARKYMVTIAEIEGPSRREEIVEARHEAMFRCSKETKANLTTIGRFFNRTHGTVIYALKRNGKDLH
jgi:chromosomal replication initiator protein